MKYRKMNSNTDSKVCTEEQFQWRLLNLAQKSDYHDSNACEKVAVSFKSSDKIDLNFCSKIFYSDLFFLIFV